MPVRSSKPRLSELPVFIGLNTPIAGLEGYTKTYRLPHSGLVQYILSEIASAAGGGIGNQKGSLKSLSFQKS